jgi:CO/xanthine dehydrogenase Mo-binding subunit
MTAQAAPPAGRVTGQPVRRKEDARVITGQARWTDNLTLPGLAHLAIVRSPMAHARIGKADVSAALEQPGVIAAFTGRDLAPDYGSLPTAWIVSDDLIVPDHPPIAADEARYLGDAVAVVVAENPYQAADAVEAVQVEYEPLPAVVDPVAALADGAPLVHAGQATNRAFTWTFSGGDYADTRRRATVVVSRRFVQQRVMPTAMEPRAVLAEPFPATGEFTLWTSTQVPHFVRLLMSSVCGIGEQKLRVIAPDVGGGFGGKLNVYAEEAIALAVARRLGRPVKWTATRGEDYQATTHGRDMIQEVEITADRDGRVLGLKVDLTYDSGNYEAATARATELFGYDALRREQAERRHRGDPVQLGIGVSVYTEMGGLAPSRWFGRHGYTVGGWETASVRLLPTGRVEVIAGTSPHGQGHETTFGQIAADTVGVPFDDIDVMHGDTDVAPWGLDTYGSRSIVVGGEAVLRAARQVVDKARVVAAHLLEVSPGDLEFGGGRFSVRGDPDASRTIQDVAFAAFAAHDLPPGADPVLLAEATVDPAAFSYPHGTHLCAVEVDTATGQVTVRSYVAVDDVGTVINPMIVDGQVHGGVTQGLAQALYEEAVYDAGGNLVTGSMVDYLVPSAADVPPYVTDRTETPATTNPLGVKGAGEAGTIGSTPAVVNAVVDALRPYGVTDIRMPCTPERVWQATHGEAR